MIEQIEIEADNSELRDYLGIKPPSDDRETSEFLKISRSRQVDFDWDQALSGNFSFSDNNVYLRKYFHDSWGLDELNFDESIIRKYFVFKVDPQDEQNIISIEIVHGSSGRRYEVLAPGFENNDLGSSAAYELLWNEKIHKLSLPNNIETIFEELDLTAPTILKQYRELKSIETFVKKLSENADKLADGFGSQILNEEEIDRMLSRFLRMKSPKDDVEQALIRLRDQASDLGYVLPLEKESFKFPDNSSVDLEPGILFQPYRTQVRWQTTHYRTETRTRRSGLFGLGRTRYRVTVREVRDHSKTVTKYQKFVPDIDPWIEKQAELSSEGYESFRFDRSMDGYFTSDGESLSSVMGRCNVDEDFRQKCAVWLPVYEQKLTEGEILVKYMIFLRPLPGIKPVRFPSLYLEEELTYKATWQHPEIGELAHTINLAPGEERKITIERTTSSEIEERRTATSVIDLTMTTSNDLSSEIQREARSSTERTRSSSWSVKAGGGFGGFSASGSAGGSNTMTAKQFSGQVQKVAKKAANTYSKRMKQEVSSTTSIKKKVTRSESTTIEVRNINEGRTLNILFYQLYNAFNGGVYLDDLQLVVIPSTEVIAGSGISLPKTYLLEDLVECFEHLNPNSLPIKAVITSNSSELEESYWKAILDRFEKVLFSDYAEEPAGTDSNRVTNSLRSIHALKFNYDVSETVERSEDDSTGGVIKKRLIELVRKLTDSEFTGKPIIEEKLLVASGGLYSDTFVGALPGTEPYSEGMRSKEIGLKQANIENQLATARYQNALANRLLSGGIPFDVSFAPNVIIESKNKLILQFDKAPGSGKWSLYIDSQVVKKFEVLSNQKIIELDWDDDQSWLTHDTRNSGLLLHDDTKFAIPFVV